jgi:hypothetical protein
MCKHVQRIFGRVKSDLGADSEKVVREEEGGEKMTAHAHEDDEREDEMFIFCIYCTRPGDIQGTNHISTLWSRFSTCQVGYGWW